jgi:hypothetical protein
MGHSEDVITQDYPYAWREGSDLSIQDFLTKARLAILAFRAACIEGIHQYVCQHPV